MRRRAHGIALTLPRPVEGYNAVMKTAATNVSNGRTLHSRFLRMSGAAFAVQAVFAATARAQAPATLPGEDGGMLQWVVAGGIAVVVCLTAFLNPKRSHMT